MSHTPQRADISACLSKLETVYGQDSNPTPESNAILINKGATITPSADKEARNNVRTTYSPSGSIMGAAWQDLSIQVEARGGGLDETGKLLPPDYDCFLRSSGMRRRDAVRLVVPAGGAWQAGEAIVGATSTATGVIEYVERDGLLVVIPDEGSAAFDLESITGGTSAATGACTAVTKALLYQPVTAAASTQESTATRFWMDSILHRHLGGVGTWSLDAQVGKLALFDFKVTGLWVDPADSDLPDPVLTELVGPQAMGMDVRIGDYVPVCTALKIDLGAKVERRNDINAANGLVGVRITGREPTGSLDPETGKLSEYNPWALWKAGTKSKINGYLGSTPGNRIAFHMGAAQRTEPKYGSRVGLVNYAETFTPCGVRKGDDEIYLCYF